MKQLFGKFSKNDLPMKSIDFASKATQNNYEITMVTLKVKVKHLLV